MQIMNYDFNFQREKTTSDIFVFQTFDPLTAIKENTSPLHVQM